MTDINDWQQDAPVVLILVGLIASGKSTFATALEEHIPTFRRCNQDDLGNRRAVERLARQSLSQGYSVCIDRTNFDSNQRAHWINIAREFPGTAVWCLVFDVPFDVCASRLRSRIGHPTIKSPEQGLDVLRRFSIEYQAPSPREGLDCVFHLDSTTHPSPSYTKADIIAILKQIRNSPSLSPSTSNVPVPTLQFFRNSSPGGGFDRRRYQALRGKPPTAMMHGYAHAQPPIHMKGSGRREDQNSRNGGDRLQVRKLPAQSTELRPGDVLSSIAFSSH